MRFSQLPGNRLVPPTDVFVPNVAGQLHRDGGEPFGKAQLKDVGLDGPKHPVPVDPVVLVEPLVFRRQERGLHIGRHLSQRDDGSPLQPQVGDEPPVCGVDLGCLIRVIASQLVDRRTGIPRTGAAPGRGQECQSKGKDGEQPDEDVPPGSRRQPHPLERFPRRASGLHRRASEAPERRFPGWRRVDVPIEWIQRVRRILWVGHTRKLANCYARFQRVP